jgi:Cu2+-exporting ATPase
MRDRARSAVTGLARLAAKGGICLGADGRAAYVPLEALAPGMVLRIAAGERFPVDAVVVRGASDLDRSLVTGESAPAAAGVGDVLEAGTLNLTGALDVRVLRAADASFLAEMMRLLEAAEQGRGAYVRLADRAARLYAPVVHIAAAATFLGWLLATGDWAVSLFVAISVLIITCPCALGLAVPVVHVVAAGRLFRAGVMMKDGSALERLAGIDRVVFDKTGTLTTGTPVVTGGGPETPDARAAALTLALASTHPISAAVAAWVSAAPVPAEALREISGCGVEGTFHGRRARLGHGRWVAEIASEPAGTDGPAFAFDGAAATSFKVAETLRPGAREAVAALHKAGVVPEMLTGDGPRPARQVARAVGIAQVGHGATPAGKIARLAELRAAGHRVLMVGDGLNDAAALAAADVSMAPASASDVGRAAADFVFTRERLDAVSMTHEVAIRASRLVRQNFGLAVVYNGIAIPLAVAGLVTPLLAAIAMSASSILVVANALRLNYGLRLRPAARHPVAIGTAVAT